MLTLPVVTHTNGAAPYFGACPKVEDPLITDTLTRFLKAVEAEVIFHLPLPGFECIQVGGRAIGSILRFDVVKTHGDDGELLDLRLPIQTLVLRPTERTTPEFLSETKAAMAQMLEVPDTDLALAVANAGDGPPAVALINNTGLLVALKNNLLTMEDMAAASGFGQMLVSVALERNGILCDMSGVNESVFEVRQSCPDLDEHLSTTEWTGATQTGGKRVNVLHVEPGDDGYPNVFAFLVDVELDVARVTFLGDGIFQFETKDLSCVMMDRQTLDLLDDLTRQADAVLEDIDRIVWDREDLIATLLDAGQPLPEDDPLEHLYTNHPMIEIDPDHAADVCRRLGLGDLDAA